MTVLVAATAVFAVGVIVAAVGIQTERDGLLAAGYGIVTLSLLGAALGALIGVKA